MKLNMNLGGVPHIDRLWMAIIKKIQKMDETKKFDFHGLTVYTSNGLTYLVGIQDLGNTSIINFLSLLKGTPFTTNVTVLKEDEWQSFKSFMEAVDL